MSTCSLAHGAAPSSTWTRWWRCVVTVVLLGWATGCASLPANTNRVASTAFAQPEQTALGQLAAARRAQAGARSDSGFHLLDGVDAALAARIALIDNAQRTLDL